MKFGFRTPSLSKRFAARTSVKRVLAHRLGLKAPKGLGVVRNPRKAVYNKVYSKTTLDPLKGRGKRKSAAPEAGTGDAIVNFIATIVGIAVFIWVVRFFF